MSGGGGGVPTIPYRAQHLCILFSGFEKNLKTIVSGGSEPGCRGGGGGGNVGVILTPAVQSPTPMHPFLRIRKKT